MKASHSAALKVRAAPRGFLLSRTLIASPVRPATSTQLPLYVLRELLIQVPIVSSVPNASSPDRLAFRKVKRPTEPHLRCRDRAMGPVRPWHPYECRRGT